MAGLLPLFWGLASLDRNARISASDALVGELAAQERGASAPAAPRAPDDAAADAAAAAEADAAERRIDESCTDDMAYALRRLVRGLASPRENARAGFAVALTELLSHVHVVAPHDVLVLLLKYTALRGGQSGQETRDMQFARLFGVHALVRSAALYGDASDEATFRRAVRVVLAVAAHKTWLSESCGWVLLSAVRELAAARPPWAADALRWTADLVCASPALSPEKLALVLALDAAEPSLRASERVGPARGCVLAPGNLPAVARALREAPPLHLDAESPAPQAGTWNPELPFVWDMLLDAYLGEAPLPDGAAPFAEFYRVALDESLFAPSASPERKSWGFQVVQRALQRAPAEVLPLLFTPQFMRTWTTQLAGKDRILHSLAHKTAELVSAAVQRNPDAGVALVTHLTREQGAQNFDRLTHTRLTESILATLDEAGIQRYLAYLRSVACEMPASTDAPNAASRRQWACDQMLALVRSSHVRNSDAWVHDVLVFLGGAGYFSLARTPPAPWRDVLPRPAVPLDDATQAVCRARFLACLAELRLDDKGHPWVLRAHEMLARMGEERAVFKSVASEAALERAAHGNKVLRLLAKRAANAKDRAGEKLQAFQTLLAAVVLITHEDEADAPDLVEPLAHAAQLLFLAKQPDPEQGLEALVDVLLELMELSSAFLRTISKQVFAVFTEDVTPGALERLLAPLGAPDEEEDEDGDEDQDEDEEVEMDDEDQDEQESGDEGEQDDAQDVDPVLRHRVEEALRDGGLAETDDEEDEEPVDTGEQDLNDEQMSQLDDKLAEIFRQHTSRAKQREEEKRDMALFHNKLLDLIEIFAKEQGGSPLLIDVVPPLYALVRDAKDVSQQVATRASQILRTRICRAKQTPSGVRDAAAVQKQLAAMHQAVRAPQDGALAELTSAVCHFYTKVLLRQGKPHAQATIDAYDATLADFLQRKTSAVRPAFLLDAIRRLPELAWGLRHTLLNGSSGSTAVRSFRQVQVLGMLQAALQQQQHAETRCAPPHDVLAFLAQVRAAVLGVVRAAAAPDADTPAAQQLNGQRLKDVLRFALQAMRITARVADAAEAPTALAECWPRHELAATAEQLQRSERFAASTSLHGLLKEMLVVAERSAQRTDAPGSEPRAAKPEKRKAKDTGGEPPRKTASKPKKRAAT